MGQESDDMDNSDSTDSQQSGLCGFLTKPFPECYCMHMSSMNIPKILQFCAGEYKLCLIYRQHAHLSSSRPDSHSATLCFQSV